MDARNLRHRIAAALDASIDECARCKVCDAQADAVMAVLREAGVFPEGAVTEWGVRFSPAGSALLRTEVPCPDESGARSAVEGMRETRPEWDAVLVRREAARPAGEWTDIPETAKDGNDG